MTSQRWSASIRRVATLVVVASLLATTVTAGVAASPDEETSIVTEEVNVEENLEETTEESIVNETTETSPDGDIPSFDATPDVEPPTIPTESDESLFGGLLPF
ncbi:hypothetical protein C482_13560 [Natrialba chahannaoensis JCM 10990]|uniref:Uncharacterized protein n=1 Tax=Natrialba chahannaoensis JCM 10990 TaxID=1227492 RepID=M0AFD9_9EURY|nr:hypothetical protein [Natrialba chahannaoensis]ELY97264.1 hypothetical protein C482_13560 [Natrialba chahannaoensis JCM 10990]